LSRDKKKKSSLISHGIAAQNRKARFDYKVMEEIEAGIERDGEMWLFNCYIPEWQAGSFMAKFEPRRPRKLLLHKKQVSTLAGSIAREGITLVPLDIHFNDRGMAKVTLGLAEGKQAHDKRASIAARDWQRDKARIMRNKGGE
jgi:SsrA-binding protein